MKLVELPLDNDKAIFVNPHLVLNIQPITNSRTMLWEATHEGPVGYQIPRSVNEVATQLQVQADKEYWDMYRHMGVHFEILTRYMKGISSAIIRGSIVIAIAILLAALILTYHH